MIEPIRFQVGARNSELPIEHPHPRTKSCPTWDIFLSDLTTKSGFMLGLGETRDEVLELLEALKAAAVDVVTIGQYLQPSRQHLPIEEYVSPSVFEEYREAGEALGFRHVFSGPFVRSSYRAEEALLASHAQRARPV